MSKGIDNDRKKLLKTYQPEIKRVNMTFRWLFHNGLESEELSLEVSEDEKSDNQHEIPTFSVGGEDQIAPPLLSIGILEITQDFPIKLSG
ncbi:MAG: hypothetical protein AB1424_13600 [Thermodesulfobacteriota bacterium]